MAHSISQFSPFPIRHTVFLTCGCHTSKPCEVDQAALTGESLPVTRAEDDKVFMGSVIRRGELEAWVVDLVDLVMVNVSERPAPCHLK